LWNILFVLSSFIVTFVKKFITRVARINITEMFDTVIPKDPIILLSFVNTRLRDRYTSLDDLCEDLGVQPAAITVPLAAVGYTYDKEQNRFV